MADNKNNRKSKRNFRLEKPVERSFDIEKEVDVATVVTPVKPVQVISEQTPIPTDNGKQEKGATQDNTSSKQQDSGKKEPPTPLSGGEKNGDGGNGANKWIIAAILAAALGIGAYFLMSGDESNETTKTETTQVDNNDSTQNDQEASDSTTDAANDNVEVISYDNVDPTNKNVEPDKAGSNSPKEYASQPSGTKSSAPSNNSQSSDTNQERDSKPVSTASNSSMEQKAKDVWKGVYGNNPDRRRNLGNDYEAVQKLVNEMYRNGLVR